MDVPASVVLDVDQAIDCCAKLVRVGWESARLALSALEQSQLAAVEMSRVKTASMAGIYRLRLGKYGDLVERALDLDRFAQKLEVISNESFIRFFSIRHQGWRILVAVSDDLNQPIAATAVRGVGGDPASTTVGAVGFISTDQARVLCNRLVEDGWDAANVAVETLSNPTPADIPFWLATPQTLARQYSSRVKDSSESSDGASVNLIRFADAMVECRDPSKYICIFHLFDDYGWQSTVAVSEDLTQPLGVVAIERSTR